MKGKLSPIYYAIMKHPVASDLFFKGIEFTCIWNKQKYTIYGSDRSNVYAEIIVL